MADSAAKDRRKATPFNPAGVSARDIPEKRVTSPSSLGLKQRGMPNAESHGKQWDGNVAPRVTKGQGEPAPGKPGKDSLTWGANVGPRITTAKPKIGNASP